MPKPISVLEQEKQNSRYKDRIIIFLGVVIVVIAVAYFRIPTKFVVYQPPETNEVFISKVGTVPPTTVYSFGNLILDRVLRCEEDCEKDIIKNLHANRAYITERCLHDIETHAQVNTQLYKNRTRELLPIDATVFTFDKVKMLNAKTWIVSEDYRLESKVRGETLRNENFTYRMKIIKSSQNPEVNPYQLQFDCYTADPIADVKK